MARRYVMALAGAGLALVTGLAAGPADARIRCNGPYQIVRGQGEIATPYCEDNYLTAIAHRYGFRGSASAVRHNPFVKEQACRLAGHDYRVRDICAGYLEEGGHHHTR